MKLFNTRQLAFGGLMAALVFVGTILIRIPTPTKGYIHIGDSLVYLCGLLLGPILGGFAAAIGSLFADIFSSYAIYAPATFLIKGIDALIVGVVFKKIICAPKTFSRKVTAYMLAVLAGGAFMVLGYLAYETVLYGFPVAILGMAPNILQALGGAILAFPLFVFLSEQQIK